MAAANRDRIVPIPGKLKPGMSEKGIAMSIVSETYDVKKNLNELNALGGELRGYL